MVSSRAMTDVNSSIRLLADLLVKCNEVTINRQKPSRFAAVFKICCDVLLAKRNVLVGQKYMTKTKFYAKILIPVLVHFETEPDYMLPTVLLGSIRNAIYLQAFYQ